MRIIAGEARGRRIVAPTGRETRPTSDRVKESLFNILGNMIPGAKVLDLFAGTGNLGLESLSRGAQHCIFIDKSREAVGIIRENVKILKYNDLCEIYNNDAINAMDVLNKRGMRFDIIFVDPPYHHDIIPEILKKIISTAILLDDGVVVAEHDIKDQVPQRISSLGVVKSSSYGDSAISFYKYVEE